MAPESHGGGGKDAVVGKKKKEKAPVSLWPNTKEKRGMNGGDKRPVEERNVYRKFQHKCLRRVVRSIPELISRFVSHNCAKFYE